MRKGMMSRITIPVLLSAAMLTSCAAPVIDETSQYYGLPVGTTVVLQQDLTIPSGNARVFMQFGKVVAKTRLKTYQASCNFEQHDVSDGTAVIRADRFRITAVARGEDLVVQKGGLRYASFRIADDGSNVSMVNLYIRYALSSPTQPQVMHLTCHGGFAMPNDAELPSQIDVQRAVGGLVSFELPEAKPQPQ